MDLPLRTHSDMVQAAAASAQAACPDLTDFSENSPLLALLQGVGHLGQFLQYLDLLVLARSRLSTSTGADVDSFVEDFFMERLAGNPSSGNVTLSRFTTTFTRFIRPGWQVRTTDGSVTFTIAADETHSAWNASIGEYQMLPGVASISVPVVCDTAGALGNVQAGTITLLAGNYFGIDAVTNAAKFSNGYDAEPDDRVKARFAEYMPTRSKATEPAIRYEVSRVQQGLSYNVRGNTDTSGAFRPGFFTVVVDDGTGAPSADLLSRVSNAVESVRGFTIDWAVVAPAVLTANVAVAFDAAPGFVKNQVSPEVSDAIDAYFAGLGVGDRLSIFRLAQVIQDEVPGVGRISSLLVNNASADVGGGPAQVVRRGGVALS